MRYLRLIEACQMINKTLKRCASIYVKLSSRNKKTGESARSSKQSHITYSSSFIFIIFCMLFFYHQLCLVVAALLPLLRLHVMASQLKKYKKDVHQMSTKLQGVYNDLQEEQSHRMVENCFIFHLRLILATSISSRRYGASIRSHARNRIWWR